MRGRNIILHTPRIPKYYSNFRHLNGSPTFAAYLQKTKRITDIC